MKRGDFVTITYGGKTLPGMVTLASPNGRSLMVSFDGALYTSDGGAFFGSMPILLDDDGSTFRDLLRGDPVGIEPRSHA